MWTHVSGAVIKFTFHQATTNFSKATTMTLILDEKH